MHTNRAIWLLCLCLVLPVGWLALTTPLAGARAALLVIGSIVSAPTLVPLAWRAPRARPLLPTRLDLAAAPPPAGPRARRSARVRAAGGGVGGSQGGKGGERGHAGR